LVLLTRAKNLGPCWLLAGCLRSSIRPSVVVPVENDHYAPPQRRNAGGFARDTELMWFD
jgi:hypothetical protein